VKDKLPGTFPTINTTDVSSATYIKAGLNAGTPKRSLLLQAIRSFDELPRPRSAVRAGMTPPLTDERIAELRRGLTRNLAAQLSISTAQAQRWIDEDRSEATITIV